MSLIAQRIHNSWYDVTQVSLFDDLQKSLYFLGFTFVVGVQTFIAWITADLHVDIWNDKYMWVHTTLLCSFILNYSTLILDVVDAYVAFVTFPVVKSRC